tara:strand:- start:3817 stop:7908 length:4092 start_codon:yes stop_codon:yes gene_type:complete
MRRLTLSLFFTLLIFNKGQAKSQSYSKVVVPLIERFCLDCHSADKAEADVNFDNYKTIEDLRSDVKTWIKVEKIVSSRQMPPKDSDQPTDAERKILSNWVHEFLTVEARGRAGDPGRVVLRRLNNDEYNYTVRDLTGVLSLNPTREFPVDGAAGEGFTNAGDAQGMSAALATKYLDAAKEVASHAVLTPTGIRFSEFTTERDRTDELLSRIQAFYRQFTDDGGGSDVDLHGIKFTTNQGGRLPLARYLTGILAEREALKNGTKTPESVANERSLNAKYLRNLWETLLIDKAGDETAIGKLREKWNATVSEDPSELVALIGQEQKKLWKFNTIGHGLRLAIESGGSPPRWMEAVGAQDLVTIRQDIKWSLPVGSNGSDVVFYLSTDDANDGNKDDYVVWRNLRLEGGGRPPMKLWELAALQRLIDGQRLKMLGLTTRYLDAVSAVKADSDLAKISSVYNVDAEILKVWLDYLAIGRASGVKVDGHLNRRINIRDGIQGFSAELPDALPSVVANSSDKDERIPGLAKAHTVVMHPTPTHFAAVGWQSPIEGEVVVEAYVSDAHATCGNGIEWLLQHRVSDKTALLWQGEYELGGSAEMTPKKISVRRGEVLSLIVGSRDNNHTCDLTTVQLVISETNGTKHVWDLAKEVSPNLQAGNPHEDIYGNSKVWHFFHGEMAKVDRVGASIITVPKGSVLEEWLVEKKPEKRKELARRVQALATGAMLGDSDLPDSLLQRQLRALRIPVDLPNLLQRLKQGDQFGRHPLGHTVDMDDLVVKAPNTIKFRIPAELAKGRELVGTVEMDPKYGQNGSVQVQVFSSEPVTSNGPILIRKGSPAQERIEGPVKRFVDLFPPALCYAKIVPVDEVVTLTLFHREDDHLRRLMLNDRQADQLDQLWDELFYVAREPLKYQVAFEQIREFATQDRPDLVKSWAPHVESVNRRASTFKKRLIDTEPVHLNAVLDFAQRSWRRPLSVSEIDNLRNLYQQLRSSDISHEDSIRLTIARVLTSPSFLYRREKSGPGKDPVKVNAYELATRLSYFLWSSCPDSELMESAKNGSILSNQGLLKHVRRMRKNSKISRMAEQFACQWLHLNDFDKNDDKNEKLFPEFSELRESMYSETLKFFEDMFRNNGSVLDIITADHTFANGLLLEHYGIKEQRKSNEWVRIEGMHERGRGGVLGMATVLAANSGASRTSPILRGNWIYETLLGEKLPRPPANVPDLPEKIPDNLTARQLIEQHSLVKECAKCHERIDPYGFSLEQFDAVGKLRKEHRDTSVRLFDGNHIDGLKGLRDYLSDQRLDDFLEQFCRKFLGYALGREIQLSDMILIEEMKNKLKDNNYRFNVLVDLVVKSDQFLKIRGRLVENDD